MWKALSLYEQPGRGVEIILKCLPCFFEHKPWYQKRSPKWKSSVPGRNTKVFIMSKRERKRFPLEVSLQAPLLLWNRVIFSQRIEVRDCFKFLLGQVPFGKDGLAGWDMLSDCLPLDLLFNCGLPRAHKKTTIQNELVPDNGERLAPHQPTMERHHPSCYQSLSFTCSISANLRKTLHESIE